MNIQQLLSQATSVLSLEKLEAIILLSFALKISHASIMAWPNKEVSFKDQRFFFNLVARRKKGEPLAYIVGNQPFWSLDLIVNNTVLVPRSATEYLVAIALEYIDQNKNLMILDLGTGSGAIGLAIAKERPNSTVIATDLSEGALLVAKLNIKNLLLKNISLICSDWFSAIHKSSQLFDVIISNPPYIAENDPHLVDLGFEPIIALTSGIDGLNAIKHIVANVKYYLKPGGWLILEHGFDQQQQVLDIFLQHGFNKTRSFCDLSHQPRVVIGSQL